MTGTDFCVRLYKSVPVICEPPCTYRFCTTMVGERSSLLLCMYTACLVGIPHAFQGQ